MPTKIEVPNCQQAAALLLIGFAPRYGRNHQRALDLCLSKATLNALYQRGWIGWFGEKHLLGITPDGTEAFRRAKDGGVLAAARLERP